MKNRTSVHMNYVTILHHFRDIITYFPKFKEVMQLNTSLLRVIYNACTRTPLYQSVQDICLALSNNKDMTGQNF